MGLQKYFKFSRKKGFDASSNKEKPKWSERIKDIYNLTIRNSESLEVVSSFKLTLLNLYLLLSAIFVLVAFLVSLLFMYTPLIRYLPGGNGKMASQREVKKLTNKIHLLESQMSANKTYNEAIKRRVLGEHQYIEKSADTLRQYTQAELNVKKNEAQRALDAEVESGTFLAEDKTILPGTNVPVSLKKMRFSSPVIGETSASFNQNAQHFGIDIIAPKGTPIKSIADGVVLFADWTMETGNTVVIKHSNDITSVYKHNEKILKKTGDIINAGEAIAIIGNTGTQTSGPHLHFELWYRLRPLNPKEYIRFE